jgi:hypothetical protein
MFRLTIVAWFDEATLIPGLLPPDLGPIAAVEHA